MKTKYFLFTLLALFITMFLLNGLFHGFLAADFFDSHLSFLGPAVNKMKDFNPVAIAILELILDISLILILIRNKNSPIAAENAMITGALFYLSTSATWNLANMATLTSWPISVSIVDIAWHTATGILAGWLIANINNMRYKKTK